MKNYNNVSFLSSPRDDSVNKVIYSPRGAQYIQENYDTLQDERVMPLFSNNISKNEISFQFSENYSFLQLPNDQSYLDIQLKEYQRRKDQVNKVLYKQHLRMQSQLLKIHQQSQVDGKFKEERAVSRKLVSKYDKYKELEKNRFRERMKIKMAKRYQPTWEKDQFVKQQQEKQHKQQNEIQVLPQFQNLQKIKAEKEDQLFLQKQMYIHQMKIDLIKNYRKNLNT